MSHEYFDERMVNRQRLLWTIATRRQLERWEQLVASILNADLTGRSLDGATWWSAEIEHHLTLVAARNLLHALDLAPVTGVTVEQTLRDELEEGRNLLEHWLDYMPVFNVTPRPAQPSHYRSGRTFAARNPRGGPDWGFTGKEGALVLPHVSAPELHRLLDAVEAEVLTNDESLSDYVPLRAPSPWLQQDGEWSPKAMNALLRPLPVRSGLEATGDRLRLAAVEEADPQLLDALNSLTAEIEALRRLIGGLTQAIGELRGELMEAAQVAESVPMGTHVPARPGEPGT